MTEQTVERQIDIFQMQQWGQVMRLHGIELIMGLLVLIIGMLLVRLMGRYFLCQTELYSMTSASITIIHRTDG